MADEAKRHSDYDRKPQAGGEPAPASQGGGQHREAQKRDKDAQGSEDPAYEASRESFPASDAPASTRGRIVRG